MGRKYPEVGPQGDGGGGGRVERDNDGDDQMEAKIKTQKSP